MIKPVVIPHNVSIAGTAFVCMYDFANGHRAPVFEVMSMHGLNQIIGHAKFNNRQYGNVYYRGQCNLYDKLMPSLFRGCKKTRVASDLKGIIKKIIADKELANVLKVDMKDLNRSTIKVEGILQHYGLPTRFLDLVDNHWIALWMGNNYFESKKIKNKYCHYVSRTVCFEDYATGPRPLHTSDEEFYQYILLLALPYSVNHKEGIFDTDNHYLVDLRQALPSVFLRPHAQHGLVARNKMKTETSVDNYDMASDVVGILKLRIDRVTQWLGSGMMLTQNNLFPPASIDCGYDILLSRKDIFPKPKFQIAVFF